MKIVSRAVWCSMLVLATATTWPRQEQRTSEKASHELLDAENRWLAAEDDPDALESILASDFLHVVSAGIITKDEQLDFMRKHRPVQGPAPARHFEDLHVRVYGEVGIVNGMVVATRVGSTRRTLFTDVFAYRDGRWQAVSAQELPAEQKNR